MTDKSESKELELYAVESIHAQNYSEAQVWATLAVAAAIREARPNYSNILRVEAS